MHRYSNPFLNKRSGGTRLILSLQDGAQGAEACALLHVGKALQTKPHGAPTALPPIIQGCLGSELPCSPTTAGLKELAQASHPSTTCSPCTGQGDTSSTKPLQAAACTPESHPQQANLLQSRGDPVCLGLSACVEQPRHRPGNWIISARPYPATRATKGQSCPEDSTPPAACGAGGQHHQSPLLL